MRSWGADAVRDCDGTDFPEALRQTNAKVYSTYYTTRKDNAWARENPEEVQLAANECEKGRSVYISGLPYDFSNVRLLHRALLWAARREDLLHTWFSSNPNVDVHAYVKNGKYCVVNNTYEPQETRVYRGDGSVMVLALEAYEIKWYQI